VLPYKYDNVLLKFEKKIIEEADIVLFPSEKAKQLVLEKYKIEDIPSKMVLLHNPVEDIDFGNRPLKPLFDRKKRAIYAGFFSIDWSLIKSLAKRFRDYEFMILGPKTRINEPNVSILGAVNFEEVLELLSESRIGIIPYKRIGEINDLLTLTKKIILMMKAKLPIVAQNVCPEVAKYGIVFAGSKEDFMQKFSELTEISNSKDFFEYDERIIQDYREDFVKSKFSQIILDLLKCERSSENI
jgi:glycosyltransferase involved in cell wall biosynthesis